MFYRDREYNTTLQHSRMIENVLEWSRFGMLEFQIIQKYSKLFEDNLQLLGMFEIILE